jgi:hypothetical protein
MAQTVKQVSVDLDRADLVMFLRAYFSSKRLLPSVPSEITVSPTGVGMHLKLFKQVTVEEDLKLRALLWDDPYRLYYALKKWALGEKDYVDLVFDEKNDRKETLIPLEDILKPHEKEVENINKLLEKGENEKADEEVKKLAKEIEPQIAKYKRTCFVGCLAFKGDQLREDLEKICTDIMQRDNTWSWKCYPCWFPDFDWIIAVFTDDRQKAWKKITWLKNRAKKDDKLILKDAETRLFVKERTST